MGTQPVLGSTWGGLQLRAGVFLSSPSVPLLSVFPAAASPLGLHPGPLLLTDLFPPRVPGVGIWGAAATATSGLGAEQDRAGGCTAYSEPSGSPASLGPVQLLASCPWAGPSPHANTQH